MERRKQIETEVGWFSMKIEREVLDETKKLAKAENISLAGYVSNLMKDAVYGKEEKTNREVLQADISDVKQATDNLAERLDRLEDKIDCINVIVTKMFGKA